MLQRRALYFQRHDYFTTAFYVARLTGNSVVAKASPGAVVVSAVQRRPLSSTRMPDPYAYTGGSWLHQNALQQAARRVEFSFDALSQVVVSACHGAAKVMSVEKKEGGYNKVFIFTLDTGDRMVARIPMRIAGPPRLTVNSEVATIEYCESLLTLVWYCAMTYAENKVCRHTSISLPQIVTWSDKDSSPVGTEYIIMKPVEGVPLTSHWSSMSAASQIGLVRSAGGMMKQLGSLQFPGYGSLYFSDAPLSNDAKIPLDNDFVLGPHVGSEYWDYGVSTKKHFHYRGPNRGPCKHSSLIATLPYDN